MLSKTNPDEIQGFLTDASNMAGGYAEQVVFPANVAEVAEMLAAAHRAGTPVTVAGAGTGVTGGRVPFGGLVLATERLARLRSLTGDATGGRACVETGVILRDLQAAAAARGWFYPPDPTEWSCFVGASVATNASGARTFKYGPTRRYVQRLQLVLASGEIFDLRRGEVWADAAGRFALPLPSGRTLAGQLPRYQMPLTRKHAAGYFVAPEMDLLDLFIGSEGTLAVITEVEVELLPQPPGVLAGIVFFDAESDLLAFVRAARAQSLATRAALKQAAGQAAGQVPGLDARALEYFDAESLNLLRTRDARVPAGVAGAIFFEQEITQDNTGDNTGDNEDVLLAAWLELLEQHRARQADSWFALNETDRQALRAFRHQLPVLVNEWIARHGQRKVSTDMAVADAEFPALLEFYQQTLRQCGLAYVIFGHIGDNHVHVNMLPRNEAEAAQARQLYRQFVERAVAVGGTVSAEHGIGKLKREYLQLLYGERGLREMAALKQLFDPAGILGRGNLFPADWLGTGENS